MAEETIGLIAGTSQFPVLFARAARRRGCRVAAVAIHGEALPELEGEVDQITWVKLGQLGKLIKAFRAAGVTRAAMCGGVTKTRMFRDVVPDLKALSLLNKIKHLADDGILRALAEHLEGEGIRIMASHELVPELLAAAGAYTRRGLRKEERDDAAVGWRVAAEIGRLDLGQSVVVRGRVVVAVEAIEGTDNCIRRGGRLAGGQAVVVKRCKPGQDQRFDLPSVGQQTVRTMAEAGCSALVIEAGRTLVFDHDEMIEAAEAAGIAVAAWTEEEAVS